MPTPPQPIKPPRGAPFKQTVSLPSSSASSSSSSSSSEEEEENISELLNSGRINADLSAKSRLDDLLARSTGIESNSESLDSVVTKIERLVEALTTENEVLLNELEHVHATEEVQKKKGVGWETRHTHRETERERE